MVSLQLLKTAIEHANDSFIITSPELDYPGPRVIYVNSAFTKMTGYSPEEIIGKTPRILQGPKTDSKILKKMKPALEKKGFFCDEIVNYRKDGTEYIIEWQITAVKDKDKVTHWVSIQRDITKRKEMETQLRNSKAEMEDRVRRRTKELQKLKERLELKVRRLEKRGIDLTENEKKVFVALLHNPYFNDTQISKRTKVVRSTVTSIRNRLFQSGWLKEIYIPDFKAMGCEIIAFSFGKDRVSELSKKFKIVDKQFRTPETTYFVSTHFDYFSIFTIKNIVDAKILGAENLYPLELCRIEKMMDFEDSVASIFGVESNKIDSIKLKPHELSKKEKEVLLALVTTPREATKIASDLKISIPTFYKLKKKLVLSGVLKKKIIPNIKKLDVPLVFMQISFNPEKKTSEIEKIKQELNGKTKDFLNVQWENTMFSASLFKDYEEQEIEFEDYLEDLYKQEFFTVFPKIISMSPKNIRFNNIDFTGITRKVLEIEG